MNTDLEQQVQELQAENQKLRQQLEQLTGPPEFVEPRQTQLALAKRVKELRCLTEIGREIAETPALPVLLSWMAERIPQAMLHPHLCKVAIEYGGQVYGATEAITLPAQVVNALWVKGDAL